MGMLAAAKDHGDEETRKFIALRMPPVGLCVSERGKNFMLAKFHNECPNAAKEARALAKRLSERGQP